MVEPVSISVITGLLGTTIPVIGVTIQDVLLTSVSLGISVLANLRFKKVFNKLTKLLLVYTDGRAPHKKNLKDFQKKLYPTLSRFSATELYRFYKFYKCLEELFHNVSFADKYWAKKMVELVSQPEKMKSYLVKKLYIDRIFKIVLVKLFNRTPPKEIEDLLYNNFVTMYMDDDITQENLESFLVRLETESDKQYLEHKDEYDVDFKKEKIYLSQIFTQANDDILGIKLTTANYGIVKNLEKQNNPMDKQEAVRKIGSLISISESMSVE